MAKLKPRPLIKIISGGQTGVDQAALVAAKIHGIDTGGYMPFGWLTEDGPRPDIAEAFWMDQLSSDKYPPRTRANIEGSDGTLALAWDFETRGEQLTKKLAWDLGKPYFSAYLAFAMTPGGVESVHEWIVNNRIAVLNIAGNAEKKNPGSYLQGYEHICKILKGMGYKILKGMGYTHG